MTMSGDFSKLARIAAGLSSLADKQDELAKRMGSEAAKLNRASYRAQKSPEGHSWQGGPSVSSPILRKTGRTLGTLRVKTDGISFTIAVSTRWAWYHQHGAVLRDSAVKTKFRRTRKIGPGRGRKNADGSFSPKHGPVRLLTFSGPIRKGLERGFLPARPIVPSGAVPPSWDAPLEAVANDHFERALRV